MASTAWFQRLRIASGLILFAFLATHLLNHSLGNVSLDAMEAGRKLFLALWRNPVGSTLLYGALTLHVLLVGYSILRRRQLRMPAAEAVQILAGLAIPLLIAKHVVATRGAHAFYDIEDSYAYVLLALWVWDWQQGVLQTAALLVAWTHGCFGLHFWLRLKPGYERWRWALELGAVLLPAAALAGFSSAGREAAHLAQDALWLQQQLSLIGLPNEAAAEWVGSRTFWVRAACAIAVAGIVGYRLARFAIERRHAITIGYPGNRHVVVDVGHTVLEASRAGRIAHASVCGGRGRCSTCRVRVMGDAEALPEPSDQEQQVLNRIRAPKGVRLACQLKPRRDIDVVPLLPAAAQARDGFRKQQFQQGSEQEIAILFGDLRAFTRFSENKLPYDVVFVINQYFRRMGDAVEGAGGRVDKFIGDGVMALFGVESGAMQGCRQALAAAAAMAEALAELNRLLEKDLGEGLRMGIGIHAGPSVVGEMGYRNAISVTAIGDAVNTASRLEAASKEFKCQLVVSEAVAAMAGVDLSAFPRHELSVRGRMEPLIVYAIVDATAVRAALAGKTAA
jgi:adenylate cyclase